MGGSLNTVPVVSKWIIIVCVGIYLISLVFGGVNGFAASFGMVPLAIAQGEWWRLITAAFLHGGLLHLAFNMYALYWLGPQLERLLGPIRFATVYFLSALGGSVASYWFSPVHTVSVGASGAIFGLMAAMIVIGRKMQADISQLAALFGINVVIGFVSGGIDWRAHLGGAAVGALTAWIMTKGTRETRNQIQVISSVAIFALLVGLVILRNQMILGLIANLVP
jgi:membrane associated rhomboid family serine protease